MSASARTYEKVFPSIGSTRLIISDVNEVGESLDDAIRGCPNLRALRWMIPECDILDRYEYEYETMADAFIVSSLLSSRFSKLTSFSTL